eukprot:COSAG05_NODE_267_length_12595_cov_7.076905_5_plen_71_part_00
MIDTIAHNAQVTDTDRQAMEPINGFVRVPDAAGLGVTLDREALARVASRPSKTPIPPFILRTRFNNGTLM